MQGVYKLPAARCYFTGKELSAHTEWADNSDGCKTVDNEINCWRCLQ